MRIESSTNRNWVPPVDPASGGRKLDSGTGYSADSENTRLQGRAAQQAVDGRFDGLRTPASVIFVHEISPYEESLISSLAGYKPPERANKWLKAADAIGSVLGLIRYNPAHPVPNTADAATDNTVLFDGRYIAKGIEERMNRLEKFDPVAYKSFLGAARQAEETAKRYADTLIGRWP